jgi:hypothetical protein
MMAQDKNTPNDQDGENTAGSDGFVPATNVPAVQHDGDTYEEFDESELSQGEENTDEGNETQELASGLDDLQNQALNSVEVTKQLEQLTDVVLSSAEVSTRSASVAADVSHDMRLVMESVSEDHKTNIRNSRLMLGGMLFFLLIGLGTFFAISTKMQLNIGELDAMSLAVAKRIVELDATVGAFTQASRSMNELTEKLEEMNQNQGKLEGKFEDINKQMATIPNQVADQSSKSLEAKLQALEKQIQTLDAKVQSLSNRPAQPSGAADIQKLKKELEAANSKGHEKAEPKSEVKSESKSAPAPVPSSPRQEPKPGAKLDQTDKFDRSEKSEFAKTPQGLQPKSGAMVAVKESKEPAPSRESEKVKTAHEDTEKKEHTKENKEPVTAKLKTDDKEKVADSSLKRGDKFTEKTTEKSSEKKVEKSPERVAEAGQTKDLKAKNPREAAELRQARELRESKESKSVTEVAQQRKDTMVVYPRPGAVAEN